MGHGRQRRHHRLDRRVSARGQDLWLIPRCVLEEDTFSAVKPMRMEMGPGREIYQHGQSLYVEDLLPCATPGQPAAGPQCQELHRHPLPGRKRPPLGQLTCCSPGRLPTPCPPARRPLRGSVGGPPSSCSASPRRCLRLAEVAFNTHDGLLVMDHGGIILKVNASFSRITGFAGEEMIGQHIDTPEAHLPRRQPEEGGGRRRQQAGYWSGEEQCLHKAGHLFPVRLMVSGIRDDLGAQPLRQQLPNDITQEKETARHIERLAYYDDLCDLYNRRSLNDIMQRTLQTPSGRWGPCCCWIWTTSSRSTTPLGHACGDLLLQAVVVRLKSLPQENLVLARTSGTSSPCCLPPWARAMSPPRSWRSTSPGS